MRITIVGSMSFYDRFVDAKEKLERDGHTVTIPKKFDTPATDTMRKKFLAMELFNSRLASADVLLVLNYTKGEKQNYVGPNTLMEIGMAYNQGKQVYLLFPAPREMVDELDAINCVVLEGELKFVWR